MTNRMLVLILAISSLLVGACSANLDISFDDEVIEGSGVMSVETYSLGGIKKVEICCGLEVDIQVVGGNSDRVEVEADDNFHSRMKVRVEDGDTLSIEPTSKSIDLRSTKPIIVRISVSEISELKVKAASEVTGTFPEVAAFKITADAAARVAATVDTDNLIVKATSASEAFVSGRADELTATANSAATLDLKELSAKDAEIDISSAANAVLTVTESVSGKANSGSDVEIYGGPGVAMIDTSSGASVSYLES